MSTPDDEATFEMANDENGPSLDQALDLVQVRTVATLPAYIVLVYPGSYSAYPSKYIPTY